MIFPALRYRGQVPEHNVGLYPYPHPRPRYPITEARILPHFPRHPRPLEAPVLTGTFGHPFPGQVVPASEGVLSVKYSAAVGIHLADRIQGPHRYPEGEPGIGQPLEHMALDEEERRPGSHDLHHALAWEPRL